VASDLAALRPIKDLYPPRTVRSVSSTPGRVLSIVAVTAVVFGLWLLITNSAHGGIAFFYAIPIGMATWWFGYRGGIVTVIAALVLYWIGSRIQPVEELWFTILVRVVAFSVTVVAVEAVRRRIDALEHSAEDLEAIRAALAPAALPASGGLDIAAAFVPSLHGVSGDFYLVAHPPDGSTVAIVGDVVGHGPVAARLATFVRAQLATFAANTGDPREILRLANHALVERRGNGREFVSAICMRVDEARGELEMAIAGHPAPLHLPDLTELRPEGVTALLGVRGDARISTVRMPLEPATGVLAYTDGATDLRTDGRLLGLEGLSEVLEPLAALPPTRLVSSARDRLLALGDRPIPDDLCLLALRPAG
jgi:serine phosphatase RsbU (regulator of sigma subunit)